MIVSVLTCVAIVPSPGHVTGLFVISNLAYFFPGPPNAACVSQRRFDGFVQSGQA